MGAQKGGLWNRGANQFGNDSKDKPNLKAYGQFEGFNLQRLIAGIAGVVPRNYVVMEVKQNLIPEDRAAILRRFPKSLYKKTAKVVMGEPASDWKTKVKNKILKQKQAFADKQYEAKVKESEMKKQIALIKKGHAE